MKFPEHYQLYITHNGHRSGYISISEYLGIEEMNRMADMTPEDVKQCIEMDSLWEIQWYPRSPCSFYWVGAATLERCFEIIQSNQWD